jgi:hypothetical protein
MGRPLIIKGKLDIVKVIKTLSRGEFGHPGVGRKTSHVDRKKAANKKSCRKKGDGHEQG